VDITPLINNLEILEIFEDKDEEEEDGVMNALSTMLWLLGEELEAASWLMEAWSRMDLIELYDKEW